MSFIIHLSRFCDDTQKQRTNMGTLKITEYNPDTDNIDGTVNDHGFETEITFPALLIPYLIEVSAIWEGDPAELVGNTFPITVK